MKPKNRKARCKNVLVIFNNEIVKLPLLRETTFPPVGDFDENPATYAVVKYKTIVGGEVMFPIESVIFLKD